MRMRDALSCIPSSFAEKSATNKIDFRINTNLFYYVREINLFLQFGKCSLHEEIDNSADKFVKILFSSNLCTVFRGWRNKNSKFKLLL